MLENPPANAGDSGLIPGSGRFPEKGNGNPFQYSCLGNPMDRGKPGRLQSMGLQRVRYNLATKQQWIHRLADLTDETHALISLNRMIYFAATKTSS